MITEVSRNSFLLTVTRSQLSVRTVVKSTCHRTNISSYCKEHIPVCLVNLYPLVVLQALKNLFVHLEVINISDTGVVLIFCYTRTAARYKFWLRDIFRRVHSQFQSVTVKISVIYNRDHSIFHETIFKLSFN